MKKWMLLILSLACAVGLLGCSGKINLARANGATEKSEVVGNSETVTKEILSSEMISSDMLGQGIYDLLQEEWAAWNAKSEEQKLLSSHMPGDCYRGFETWAECEEFLGFDVFNPLEDNAWPEKGTYVGMPVGYADAPRFYISFYGTIDGKVERIRVESGYRSGEIRIMVEAQVLVDAPKEVTEDEEPLITMDSGERYVASTALLAHGPVTYSIRVIGEPNMQSEVQETLKQVLPYFEGGSE